MPTIAEIYKTISLQHDKLEAEAEAKKALLSVPVGSWSPSDLNQLGLTSSPITQILAMRISQAPASEQVILAICRLADTFTILRAVQEPLAITGWVRIDADKPGTTSARLEDLYHALSADERKYLGIKDSELVAAACICCGVSLVGGDDSKIVSIRVGAVLNIISCVCAACEKPFAKTMFELVKNAEIPTPPPEAPTLGRNLIL